MPYPTLHQLEVFHVVARRRSFARAAEELYLSPPSVSLQVQHLEQFYGTPLLRRTSHGPELTEPGQILYDATEALFPKLQEASAAIERTRFSARRRIAIGATIAMGIYRVPEVVTVFRRRFPQTEVNLVITDQEQLERDLLLQTAEVGIMGREAQSPHLCAEPISMEDMVLLAHPRSPLASQRIVSSATLATQTFLMREPGSYTRRAVEEAMSTGQLKFKKIVPVEGLEGLIQAVVEKRGVGFAPAAFCELERRRGQIAALSVADVSITVNFYLVYRSDRPLTDAGQAFVECCREVFSPSAAMPELE